MAPLTDEEMVLVKADIEKMINTHEQHVTDFIVTEATPERIDRLLAMPSFARMDKTFKENTLILAGQGQALSFEKPSDILHKMEGWFPDGIKTARTMNDRDEPQGLFSRLDVYGPFPGWQPEPSAFMTLWMCMPEHGWLLPDTNPFSKLHDFWNGGKSYAHIQQGMAFGQCVDQPGRYFHSGDEIPAIIGNKFQGFLQQNRCQGTGADDCVLLLLLWSDMTPADPALADLLRELEQDVKPDGDNDALLPATIKHGSYLEPCPACDEGLRKLAFLRAKLASVLAAPELWPEGSLAVVFHQMTVVRTLYREIFDSGQPYDITTYGNAFVSPWSLLSVSKTLATPVVSTALVGEIFDFSEDKNCALYKQWVQDLPEVFRAEVTEKVIKKTGKSRRCAQTIH